MDSYIQVLSFSFSLLYGILFYLLTKVNYYILNERKKLMQFVVTLVFIVDIVILYVYLMYRINNGNFHIYFIIFVILGFILMNILYDKLKLLCKNYVNKIKNK